MTTTTDTETPVTLPSSDEIRDKVRDYERKLGRAIAAVAAAKDRVKTYTLLVESARYRLMLAEADGR